MAAGKYHGVDIGLFILRIALAGIFIAHGVVKLTTVGVEGFSESLANMGIPYPYYASIATISVEIGGGLLVFLGLLARLGGLGLAVVMVIAIWKVHWANGFFLKLEAQEPGRLAHGYEFCLALLAMALCILFAGPGQLALLPSWRKKKG